MENIEEIRSICKALGCEYGENVPMRDYTTFRIGGPVPFMLFPGNTEQIAAVRRALYGKCRVLPVGCGSNMLVSDEGVDAVAIHLGKNFSRIEREGETLICEAGATMAQACQAALKNELTGMEFAWGIPGSMGGGAYMNAGAYGGEFSDIVLWCEHVDEKGNIGQFSGEELDYHYRHSVYSGQDFLVTQVAVRLQKGDPGEIRARMDDLLSRRRSKQPLEYPSAGSTFKRPEGAYAAALIEQCGLKGLQVGGAMVSPKHSGFVINCGNATCADVLELIRQVRETVQQQTGYVLEREVELFR